MTLVTVTGLAVCGLMLPRHAASTTSVPAKTNDNIAAAGIDYTPVGSSRPIDKKKLLHRRQ